MKQNMLWFLIAGLCGFLAIYFSLSDYKTSPNFKNSTEKAATHESSRLKSFIWHKTPKAITDFEFLNEAGETTKLSEFAGKRVLVNLWATWCGPCREEMPSLNKLKSLLAKNKFDVVAISMDRGSNEKPLAFFKEFQIDHLKFYQDTTGRGMFKLKAVGMPATLLINKKGEEIGRLVGPADWSSNEALNIIKKGL